VPSVTFVSTNAHKAREVHALLAPYGVAVKWLSRTLPEPQADDLTAVVRSKLSAVPRGSGYYLVEDSGLFIPSLHGFPGVYSAYFQGIWGPSVKFRPFLELLARRPRAAVFRTVAGLRHGNRVWTFVGESRGRIAPRPRGSNGFGYDPIFIPAGHSRTFGEMTADAKNALSHRARAIEKVGRHLAR
jgi:XTP/dITP diphosphohydrolase